MAEDFEEGLASWPQMTATGDGGVLVTGRHSHPGTKTWWNTLGALCLVVVAIVGLAQGSIAAAAAMFAVIWVPCALLRHRLFTRKLNIRLYPDRIETGGKRYARTTPIEFRVERHHRALQEEKLARRRGQLKRVYRDGIEAVMQYGEKRVVVAEMPDEDQEMARALVIRLQNVCENIDRVVERIAGEKKPRAASDFGPSPAVR